MKEVKVALVGIAGYGENYTYQLLNAKPGYGINFVAGIDPFSEQSKFLNSFKEKNIPIYSDLDTFSKNNSADLIIISTGIHLHKTQSCQALSYGANVLCEKPLCATIDDAIAMLDAQKKAGKFLAVGYQWSFTNAITNLKKDIISGVFGKPIRLKTKVFWPRPLSYYNRNKWAGKIKNANGDWVLDSPVNNATAHFLHNMFFVLGNSINTSAQLKSVQAQLYRANKIENYDTAVIHCKTTDDVEVLFYTAHPLLTQDGPEFEFEFKDAVVEYGKNGVKNIIAKFKNGQTKEYGNPDDTIENKLWHCVESARTGRPIECTVESALTHTICVNKVQEFFINSFSQDLIREEKKADDTFVWVNGLYEALSTAYISNSFLKL